jgi:hypothetical protein
MPDGAVMRLEVLRFSSGREDTLSLVSDVTDGRRRFLCFGLEDQYQTSKVPGETRIPAGVYELTLRTEGRLHGRYATRFREIHEGMIWVRDVPGFRWILWHCGNTDADTEGCLLLGDTVAGNVVERGKVLFSRAAYSRVYPQVRDAIKAGPVVVEYVDAG